MLLLINRLHPSWQNFYQHYTKKPRFKLSVSHKSICNSTERELESRESSQCTRLLSNNLSFNVNATFVNKPETDCSSNGHTHNCQLLSFHNSQSPTRSRNVTHKNLFHTVNHRSLQFNQAVKLLDRNRHNSSIHKKCLCYTSRGPAAATSNPTHIPRPGWLTQPAEIDWQCHILSHSQEQCLSVLYWLLTAAIYMSQKQAGRHRERLSPRSIQPIMPSACCRRFPLWCH